MLGCLMHGMTGEGTGAPANGATDTQQGEMPTWFREYAAQVDKRFEGIASKLRAPEPPKSAEPANGPAPAASLTMDDLRAARAYEAVRSGLSDAARAKLDALEEEGWSYAQLQRTADLLRSVRAPANGGAPAERSAPTGLAATPAQSGSVAHPSTRSEFIKLMRESRTKYDALMADPTFDPTKLRNV